MLPLNLYIEYFQSYFFYSISNEHAVSQSCSEWPITANSASFINLNQVRLLWGTRLLLGVTSCSQFSANELITWLAVYFKEQMFWGLALETSSLRCRRSFQEASPVCRAVTSATPEWPARVNNKTEIWINKNCNFDFRNALHGKAFFFSTSRLHCMDLFLKIKQPSILDNLHIFTAYFW